MKGVRLLVMAAITGFWAVMWTLLIRSEVRPAEAALHALPMDVVLRQYFQHEQPSMLFLREHGENIGHLRLDPKVRAGGYELGLIGGAELNRPGEVPEGTALQFTLPMDAAFHPRSMRGAFTRRFPPGTGVPPVRVEFSADFLGKSGHYRYSEGGTTVLEQAFTLDENGLAEVLEQWGAGPEWKRQVPPVSAGDVTVTARQVRLVLHEEPTEVTQVTVSMSGQTWLEFSLSSLGQVLEAKTLWGWTLSAE